MGKWELSHTDTPDLNYATFSIDLAPSKRNDCIQSHLLAGTLATELTTDIAESQTYRKIISINTQSKKGMVMAPMYAKYHKGAR